MKFENFSYTMSISPLSRHRKLPQAANWADKPPQPVIFVAAPVFPHTTVSRFLNSLNRLTAEIGNMN